MSVWPSYGKEKRKRRNSLTYLWRIRNVLCFLEVLLGLHIIRELVLSWRRGLTVLSAIVRQTFAGVSLKEYVRMVGTVIWYTYIISTQVEREPVTHDKRQGQSVHVPKTLIVIDSPPLSHSPSAHLAAVVLLIGSSAGVHNLKNQMETSRYHRETRSSWKN